MGEAHAKGGEGRARFSDIRHHDEVDSTNRVAVDLARAGAGEGVVVVTDHQTAGRGRWGRTWVAPRGSSLLASVVLRPAANRPPALTTVAAALAAAEACSRAAHVRPTLRWPNDLMVGDRKLGGILAEVLETGAAMVVGLGVNLRWPDGIPDELADVAIALEDVDNAPVDRDRLLAAYLEALEKRWVALAEPAGRRGVLDEYRERCDTFGRAVRVRLPAGVAVGGTAVDVEEDGRLMVVSGGATLVLAAGDVMHLTDSGGDARSP